jgi:hypothetical protein
MRNFLRYDALVDGDVWIPVRGAGGGDSPPGPSAAQNEATDVQTQVMRQQLAIAKQQQAYSNAITPLELGLGGYDIQPITDPNAPLQPGQYRIPIGGKQYVVTQRADLKNLQDLNTQVATAGATRALKASKGELDVDPGVEQDLTRSRTSLQEELLKRLGPGYETSDPGIRAMNEFDRQANSIRFQVRYGELSNADALSNNAQNALQRQQSQYLGNLQGVQNPFAITSQMLGGAGQTGGNIVQQQQNQNFGAFGLGLQSSQIGAGMISSGVSGLVGAGGTVGGAMIL